MKTKSEIAKALLERRSRMTHVILPGEITAELGPDSVAEALKNHWLMPDTDTGFLCVSQDRNIIEEMIKAAGPTEEAKPQSGPDASGGHGLSLLHTHRSHAIHEIAAPATGQPSPGLSSISQPQSAPAPMPPPQPPQAAPPTPMAQPSQSGYSVGMPVSVARQGMKSVGVIEKMMPDGRFQVGFAADQKKPQGDNVFGKDEVSLVPSAPHGQPATGNQPVIR